MKADANYFRLGLFVIVGLILFAGALITFGLGHFLKPKIFVETYIDGTAQGIDVGSPVKFRGVSVGSVSQTGFLYNIYPEAERLPTSNLVVIVMRIDKELFPHMFEDNIWELLKTSVNEGLRVQIAPQGITGLNYMEIGYLDPKLHKPLELRWKPKHPYLPSAPGQLTSALDSLNNIMRELESINIKGISEEVQSLLKNVNKAVTEADIAAISKNIQDMTAAITKAVEQLDVEEISTDFQGVAIDARSLIDGIQKSNEQLQQILANLEPASAINPEDVEATLSNLQTITDNLNTLTEELKNNPSSLLFSKPPGPSKVMGSPTRR